MFEVIQPLVPSPSPVGDAEVDALERAVSWALPPDYRAFLTTFGAGTLNLDPPGEVDVLHLGAPSEVLTHTSRWRALYGAPKGEARGHLFWYFEHAANAGLRREAASYTFTWAEVDQWGRWLQGNVATRCADSAVMREARGAVMEAQRDD